MKLLNFEVEALLDLYQKIPENIILDNSTFVAANESLGKNIAYYLKYIFSKNFQHLKIDYRNWIQFSRDKPTYSGVTICLRLGETETLYSKAKGL